MVTKPPNLDPRLTQGAAGMITVQDIHNDLLGCDEQCRMCAVVSIMVVLCLLNRY